MSTGVGPCGTLFTYTYAPGGFDSIRNRRSMHPVVRASTATATSTQWVRQAMRSLGRSVRGRREGYDNDGRRSSPTILVPICVLALHGEPPSGRHARPRVGGLRNSGYSLESPTLTGAFRNSLPPASVAEVVRLR